MKSLAILVLCGPSVGEARLTLEEFFERFERVLKNFELHVRFVLSCNEGKGADFCRKFASTKDCVEVYIPPTLGGDDSPTNAGAGRYVYGLHKCTNEADFVLEIDAEGAHNPLEAEAFIRSLLAGKRVVLSTRSSMGGRDYYPPQRRLASAGITILSNVFLGLGRPIWDMASGFEAFESTLLRQVFQIHPPEEWITLQSTTALIQTELRACVLWLQDCKSVYRDITILPITYGAEKTGRNFPASVGWKALQGFIELCRYRQEFLAKKPAGL